jgi:NADPH-dependent glutamate synthase beta subunit-like oxidoreductase
MGPDALAPDWPPCTKACPAGIDIPGYLRLITEGKPKEACALILEKVPFPGILGRVCMHPCEDACRRREVFHRPISICALKRYAADNAGDVFERALKAEELTGRNVAVIGAGPAGLTAAFYLRKRGHHVTVFEAKSKAGGMMRYGIPSYRLPEDVLEEEINRVLSVGIQLETKKRLGKDFLLDDLQKDGVEAIYIATGLQLSLTIDLEGSHLDDVLWGIDFLNHIAQGKKMTLKDKILVVGGGNVAVDVALSALRVGAGHVTMACLESRDEMPASPWELEMALVEGVKLMTSWGPKKILAQGGKVTGAELIQCASVFDEKGDFCPAFNDMTEEVEVDQIILAIGQKADLSFADEKGKIAVENGLIVTNKETQETAMEGVFSGGDAAQGPGAVIDAIASGRKAAIAIDRYLGGKGDIEETLAERPAATTYTGKREKGFADLQREEEPTLPIEERHTGFSEVALCFESDQAVREAKRCLQCDLELTLGKLRL